LHEGGGWPSTMPGAVRIEVDKKAIKEKLPYSMMLVVIWIEQVAVAYVCSLLGAMLWRKLSMRSDFPSLKVQYYMAS